MLSGRVKFAFCHLLPHFRLYTWNGKRTTLLIAFYVFTGADCIQGARAQQKRERKSQNAPKATKSQAKSNEMAKNIICLVCKQPFVRFFRIPFPCYISK